MKKILITLIALNLILATLTLNQFLTITYMNSQQHQNNIIKSYLMANYGVSSVDELIQKKLEEYGLHYTGNPFTTALYPGQLQAENITGMHWYTYLSGTLLNRTDVLAFPEQSASYIIFGKDTDGDGVYDVVYAKNGTTEQIEFSGSDAATVIQNAVNKASGVIFFKKGSYNIASTITLKSDIIIVGEGRKTILNNTGEGYMIYISQYISNVRISNLKITSETREEGIDCHGDNVVFDKLNIEKMRYAISITGHTSCAVVQNCLFTNEGRLVTAGSNVLVLNNIFEGSGILAIIGGNNINVLSNIFINAFATIDYQGVIHIDPVNANISGAVIACNFIRFTENPPYRQHGIVVSGEAKSTYSTTEVIVCDNIIDGGGFANLSRGIYLHGYSLEHLNVKNVLVKGNIIKRTAVGFGIANTNTAMFTNNVLHNVTKAVSMDDVSLNIVFKRNIGFVTESSGVTSGLANGGWIPHGLAGTPTTVSLTCLNSTYDGEPVMVYWDKANTNSTHIAVDIYWVNGTAITDNVIAVSWHAEYQP